MAAMALTAGGDGAGVEGAQGALVVRGMGLWWGSPGAAGLLERGGCSRRPVPGGTKCPRCKSSQDVPPCPAEELGTVHPPSAPPT